MCDRLDHVVDEEDGQTDYRVTDLHELNGLDRSRVRTLGRMTRVPCIVRIHVSGHPSHPSTML